MCVTETKLDQTDVISVPGYTFFSQQRKQKYIRKSGGIGLFCKQHLRQNINVIETETDYIMWIRLDKTLFGTSDDLILGILYISPSQSRFLNDDEMLDLETEITSMCGQSSLICLTGDMNARTATLCDFITADSFIADLFDFDEETLRFYNQAEQLHTLNINKNRISRDKHTNNNGYKLIEICINNNLFILNGRFGKDKTEGKLTFRDQSLIDYTICSFDCLRMLVDFEVIKTDCLISDGHALLSWSLSIEHQNSTTAASEEVSSPTHKKWDSKLADEFMKKMPFDQLNDLYHSLEFSKQSINQTTSKIADIFSNTAKQTFPQIKQNKGKTSKNAYFGPKCRVARKHYNIARKTYNKCKTKQNHTKLLECSRKYKKTMNFFINKRKQKNATRLRSMHSTSPKDYWRYLNSLNKKQADKKPPLQDFYDYFKKINSSPNSENFDSERMGYNENDNNDILNIPITENEINLAIRNLKSGKSAGLDGIVNEYIKTTAHFTMPLYTKLFNIIFETGILPDSWLEGRIIPIFKNKGDHSNPENYRPITILSCLSKVFTSVLNNRLTKYLDSTGGLNENQAGFRKGYSTIDHIFSLNTLLELHRAKKQKLYCAFIDFSKAFDSVWRVGLWRKLLENNINGKFFQVINSMYNGIKSCISINGQDSPFFTCDCGVRQGENLSPVLFAIYLNDLETYLLHKNLSGDTIDIPDGDVQLYLKLFSLLYADDTIIMADNPSDFQRCLHAFSEYCTQWKLTINVGKTKIIIFGTRGLSNLLFKIGDEQVEIVKSYKYLGVL